MLPKERLKTSQIPAHGEVLPHHFLPSRLWRPILVINPVKTEHHCRPITPVETMDVHGAKRGFAQRQKSVSNLLFLWREWRGKHRDVHKTDAAPGGASALRPCMVPEGLEAENGSDAGLPQLVKIRAGPGLAPLINARGNLVEFELPTRVDATRRQPQRRQDNGWNSAHRAQRLRGPFHSLFFQASEA